MSMTSAPGEPGTGVVPGSAEPSPEPTAAAAGRYGLLLLLLISSYLFSAFTTGVVVNAVQIVVFVGAVLLALRGSLIARWLARLIAGIVTAGSAVAMGLAISRPDQPAVGVAEIWAGLVLLTAVVVIVHRILDSPNVTVQSIYAAVSAYMITGLMFAAFYGAMNLLTGTPFFTDGQPGNTKTFQYFSFTTLTTLGYDDFTAASSAGRAVAVMEAMSGQVFLATLVARLVAAFQRPRSAQIARQGMRTRPGRGRKLTRTPAGGYLNGERNSRMSQRRVLFGASLGRWNGANGADVAGVLDLATIADAAGPDLFTVADHLYFGDKPTVREAIAKA